MKLHTQEIVYLIIHLLTIVFLARSLFFIFKTSTKIHWFTTSLWATAIISGLYFLIRQTNDIEAISVRVPFMSYFIFISSFAFYEVSKKVKQEAFSITNMVRDYLPGVRNKAKKIVIAKGTKVSIVEFNTLKDFTDNQLVELNKRTAIMKLGLPIPNTLQFYGFLKMNGEFGVQMHPNSTEYIYVDAGEVMELHTKKIYKKGSYISLDKAEPHGFKGMVEFSVLRGVLTRENI